ncbi:unnamed protein product [Sphenostylis stenocarpa]|uniref:F-box domain-containing protein n=1 Tax=Sphenostylis stenocarpa TaxID=92480 RepID=A0AA86TH29_9FABA|nr:unnamed protein product [Sphenostylis stenocarpa]
MAQSNWEADKMLDVYIYDYLVKKKLHNTAKAFMTEGKVSPDPVAIDAPGGFLFEWWSVFWDIFIARTNEKHSETAAAYLEAQQIKVKEQHQLQMQQLQLIRQAQLQRRDSNHPPLGGPVNTITTEGVLGQSTASALAAKMYEERMKHSNPMDTETSQPLLDARMALLKSTNHPGQMVQGNSGSVTAALQQIQARTQQTPVYASTVQSSFEFSSFQDIKGEVNMGSMQRSLPMDPSSIYGQGGMQSKPGIANSGEFMIESMEASPIYLDLYAFHDLGIDQIRPGFGAPVQKPLLQSTNQFQLLPQQQQQQLLAQVQAQGNIGNSPVYGDMDPQRLRGLTRGSLNAKEGQSIANDGSIGSPMQSTSSKTEVDESIKVESVLTRDDFLSVGKPTPSSPEMIFLVMSEKAFRVSVFLINMPQIQQSTSQQQQDPLHPQQLVQNNRKRKGPTSSGPANSTGTGNTLGPSNSQPSTPSTHTPGDGVAMAVNLQNVAGVSKGLMMYGTDGTGGLASSTNQLLQDDMEHFGDVGSLEDNVESFLSQDDGDGRDLFGTLKRNPSEHATDASKGFSFSEVSSIRKSNSKVVCCHFSSDGKLLASAGHDKKVVLWNMETLDTESTPEEHSLIITDVRFRPNSTELATSSFDSTVRLWDASNPTFCLQAFSGHTSQVVSLDFHPKKNDIFCSCDNNSEIRFWNISQYSCTRVFKQGGSTQVRFQPRVGHLLAAASGSIVSLFDVETDRQMHTFQGHSADVHCVCWDTTGDYLASVSQESVKVWSITSGECIHELNSSGNMYHSCVFHPSYSTLLVIGGYQSLELWNMVENRCMTISAHECVISALAQSPVTGMVASARVDCFIFSHVKETITSQNVISDMEKKGKEGPPISLLDLPESILDFILKCLSPVDLSTLSKVCVSLKGKCESDHFWENHIKHKWGRVIGDAVYKEWLWHITIARDGILLKNQHTNQTGSMGSFTGVWPNLYLGSYLEHCKVLNGQRSNNFMMSLYFSLESGRFWFPAQVYKGLMIHNALVNYDPQSNTFQARYQSGGWRCIGKNIEWDMVRAPSVDSSPYGMHVSHCLENLKPEDHIEIQWRPSTQCPYDWWYAVIGHLDSCNENRCECQYSDTLMVEFRQYPEESNMRRVKLCRKRSGEEGDRISGCYGGIRKLHNEDEIQTWKKLFPTQVQDSYISSPYLGDEYMNKEENGCVDDELLDSNKISERGSEALNVCA